MADKARKGAYLPPAPEGWKYTVVLESEDAEITVGDGKVQTQFRDRLRTDDVAALPDGIQAALRTAKEIDGLIRAEAKAEEAKAKVLGTFGLADQGKPEDHEQVMKPYPVPDAKVKEPAK